MAYAKYPTSKQLKKELEKKKPAQIYLFLGEEEGEKDKVIEKILNIKFKGNGERKNLTGRYNIFSNDDFISAADFALSRSIFSADKVCIIKKIDNIKSIGSNKHIFADLITNLPETNTLIMTSDKNKLPVLIKKNELQYIKVVQFWKFFDNELMEYININFKKLKIDIESRAISQLLELTGKDIKKIDEAIELLKYSPSGEIITAASIKNLLHDVKDVSVFECTDMIFKKDFRSLKCIKKLLENGAHELLILNFILKEAENIEKYHSRIKSGVSINEAIKDCGIFSNKRDNFLQYVKIFSMEKLKKIFSLIAKADFEIKSSGRKKYIITNPVIYLVSEILMD